MLNDEIISIIFVHYAANKDRAELGRKCYSHLHKTVEHLPVELIVIDNGGNKEDSEFFIKETEAKRITHYVRNADNLWFGYARNQGLAMATGRYICIIDNDIMLEEGWLEPCIDILKKTIGQKYFVTPLRVDHQHRWQKWYRDPVVIDNNKYVVNAFAGSSCWLMRREDADAVGEFENRLKAGTEWCRRYSKMKYAVIVFDGPWKAKNLGTRTSVYAGYGKKIFTCPINKHFLDGSSIQLNV